MTLQKHIGTLRFWQSTIGAEISAIAMEFRTEGIFKIQDFSVHMIQSGFQALQKSLDSGKSLPFTDGVPINGQASTTVSGDQGILLRTLIGPILVL